MSGDSSPAQVDPDSMRLTSFDDNSIEPAALSCRDDAMVDKGAAVPIPCFFSVKMRTLTAAVGLLPAGKAFAASRTLFHQPPLWCCPTEDMNSRALVQYATYYSRLWKTKVLETKTRQTLVFDPSGSTGRLRGCPFLSGWQALLSGAFFVWTSDSTRGWSAFW